MNEMFKYGNLCDKYNMDGDIKVGTGTLRVHDIFNLLPDFMRQADVLFSDPPCSKANINSFYAKAEKEERQESYEPFYNRFFEVIDEIKPRVLFLEVFKANRDKFLEQVQKRYKNTKIVQSMYYNKPSNKCWIIQASDEPLQEMTFWDTLVDEEKVIQEICNNVEYSCIADPCMGKGLVAFYSNRAGKPFVGTELNKYRLAVAVERVSTNSRGRIN